MRIRVLGCSGGIGLGFHTSSYMVNHNVLIDAGTGVGELSVAEMADIDHIFISHAHMDHIACLPLLIDTTITHRKKPVTIVANRATINLLKAHIFNNAIWPDFSVIPSPKHPFIVYQEIADNECLFLNDHCSITAIPVVHTIPTLAYQLTSKTGNSYVICGDTSIQDDFWHTLNAIPKLKGLAIEAAFSDSENQLALISKHLSPNMLINELSKLKQDVPIYVMHLKPNQSETIIRELILHASSFKISLLFNNQIIEI